jgi:alkylhydroperoxidase/carboxymuconolactone decarboxylase family protein YurZ
VVGGDDGPNRPAGLAHIQRDEVAMPISAYDDGHDKKPKSGAARASDDKMDTFDLPLFEMLRTVDPNIVDMFQKYLNYTIFTERPLALDLKTKYLILVGITTAVRGDREGIEWSSQLAQKYGASEPEVLEAISLANLPAGTPSIEYAADVWYQMKQGDARVQRRGTTVQTRGFAGWDAWEGKDRTATE